MKVVLIVLGAVASVLALGLLVAGFGILALVDSDGFVESGEHPVQTATRALVSRTASATEEAERVGRLGDLSLRLEVTPRADEPVFVGVGPTADVTAYLRDVDRDLVRDLDFDPFRLVKVRAPGDEVPAPPSEQDFWAAQATGDGTATLDWKVREGEWRFVVMNADGSPDVRVEASFGVEVPFARPLAFILLGAAVLGLVVGVLLIVIGIRKEPKPKEPPAFAPPPGDLPPGDPAPAEPAPPVV